MPQANLKVFLVEDDPTLVEMYKVKFTESGFDLTVSGNGSEGLAIALKQPFDIILLDIILPGMDGFAILQELKKNPKTKATPVVMMSNLGQEADISRGKELGADDYLVKASFTPSQVVEKMVSIVGKK